MFFSLCGYAPFQAENDQQLVAEIARCNVVFHERYWRDVSVEGTRLICEQATGDMRHQLFSSAPLLTSINMFPFISTRLYQESSQSPSREAIDCHWGPATQVDYNRNCLWCGSFGQCQGGIQRQVRDFRMRCEIWKEKNVFSLLIHNLCLSSLRRMFKKTIRAVAAANRLRTMTRVNTDKTSSSSPAGTSSATSSSSQVSSPNPTPPATQQRQ